jgi:hypothetical protein
MNLYYEKNSRLGNGFKKSLFLYTEISLRHCLQLIQHYNEVFTNDVTIIRRPSFIKEHRKLLNEHDAKIRKDFQGF